MKLENKKVAIVSENGFEESELFEPYNRLKNEGAIVDIISSKKEEIQAMKAGEWTKKIKVDKTFEEVSPEEYDALILPGGVINPDKVRDNATAVKFIKHFGDAEKPIAAICHGPWPLINAELVKGKKMTSFSSIKIDLINAGANWVDEEVVVDKGIITSRTPDDLPVFLDKMVDEIAIS